MLIVRQYVLQCVLHSVLPCVLLCVWPCVLHCLLHSVLYCVVHCVWYTACGTLRVALRVAPCVLHCTSDHVCVNVMICPCYSICYSVFFSVCCNERRIMYECVMYTCSSVRSVIFMACRPSEKLFNGVRRSCATCPILYLSTITWEYVDQPFIIAKIMNCFSYSHGRRTSGSTCLFVVVNHDSIVCVQSLGNYFTMTQIIMCSAYSNLNLPVSVCYPFLDGLWPIIWILLTSRFVLRIQRCAQIAYLYSWMVTLILCCPFFEYYKTHQLTTRKTMIFFCSSTVCADRATLACLRLCLWSLHAGTGKQRRRGQKNGAELAQYTVHSGLLRQIRNEFVRFRAEHCAPWKSCRAAGSRPWPERASFWVFCVCLRVYVCTVGHGYVVCVFVGTFVNPEVRARVRTRQNQVTHTVCVHYMLTHMHINTLLYISKYKCVTHFTW